jgi:hypothetical protein
MKKSKIRWGQVEEGLETSGHKAIYPLVGRRPQTRSKNMPSLYGT